MVDPLEREVEKELRWLCDSMGLLCIRMQSGTARGKRGFMQLAPDGTPDYLVVLSSGRSLWIETKRPKGGKVSAAQVEMHRRLRDREHTVLVATTGQEILDALKAR